MAEPRRLFFALWPDPTVRLALARVQEGLQVRRGRHTHAEDLHVTLAFLGPVRDERLACIEEAAAAVRAPSFVLRIDHTGFWPRPRILWSGASLVPDALLDLVRALQQGLVECGFTPESRPYRPHVTLVRDARGAATGPLEAPLEWHCERFALVASDAVRDGPRYRVLREWRLAVPGS